MRSISTFAIAAALALSAASTPPALAQTNGSGGPALQDGAQGGHPGDAGGGPNMGNMTLQQVQARLVSNLMRMDTDHDGRVSLAEWTVWREAHPGRGGGQAAPARTGAPGRIGDPARAFARLDLNHDGYITSDEMAAEAARRYARMQQGVAPGMGPGGGDPPPQLLGPQ